MPHSPAMRSTRIASLMLPGPLRLVDRPCGAADGVDDERLQSSQRPTLGAS